MGKFWDGVIDKLWSVFFCLTVMACGLGAMFLGAIGSSELLGPSLPGGGRYGVEKIVEALMLFGSLSAGFLLGALIIRACTAQFMAPRRLQQRKWEFEEFVGEFPAPVRAVLRFIDRIGTP